MKITFVSVPSQNVVCFSTKITELAQNVTKFKNLYINEDILKTNASKYFETSFNYLKLKLNIMCNAKSEPYDHKTGWNGKT